MTAIASAADRTGFYLFTLCVSFAPIPFGATDPSVAGCIGLVLAVCVLLMSVSPKPAAGTGRLFRVAILLAGFVMIWTAAQAAAWHLAPATHPAWGTAAQLIADDNGQLFMTRYSILLSAGYVLLPLAGFLCALLFVRDDARYMRFVHIVLGVNVIVAIACIAQFLVAPRTLLWSDKKHYTDAFTGTFVNPNTAATHFGVLLLLALGLSMRQFERVNLYAYFSRGIRSPMEGRDLRNLSAYVLATFLFLMALLLSKSRAGILASLAGVAGLVASFVFFALRRRMSKLQALAISGLSVLGVLVVFLIFGERFLLRFQDQGLIEPGRLCTYFSTWAAILGSNWWGTGLGTFHEVFPAYRAPECGMVGHWEMAHSVLLEGVLVFGIAFLICAAVVYYELIKSFGQGVRNRRRYRFVPLTCLAILAILTLHSLVDFSLQVPGFALAAAAALGSGAAVSLRTRAA